MVCGCLVDTLSLRVSFGLFDNLPHLNSPKTRSTLAVYSVFYQVPAHTKRDPYPWKTKKQDKRGMLDLSIEGEKGALKCIPIFWGWQRWRSSSMKLGTVGVKRVYLPLFLRYLLNTSFCHTKNESNKLYIFIAVRNTLKKKKDWPTSRATAQLSGCQASNEACSG